MTWYLDSETGDLYYPNGDVADNLGDGPFTLPDDVQDWAYPLVKEIGIVNLTDEQMLFLFEAAGGEVKFGIPPEQS